MSTLIILIHVIVSVALIFIVLLQSGRGADIGATFGGGSSQTLFGSTGASTFLGKLTTVAAVVFMLTCLSLAYLSSRRPTSSIISDAAPVAEEAQQVPTQAPAESAATESAVPEQPADTAAEQSAAAEQSPAAEPTPEPAQE